MKAVVAAFNQEKALVGAFSVITNLHMKLFEALVHTYCAQESYLHSLNLCSAVLSTEAEATETEVMLTDYPPDFPRILEKTS